MTPLSLFFLSLSSARQYRHRPRHRSILLERVPESVINSSPNDHHFLRSNLRNLTTTMSDPYNPYGQQPSQYPPQYGGSPSPYPPAGSPYPPQNPPYPQQGSPAPYPTYGDPYQQQQQPPQQQYGSPQPPQYGYSPAPSGNPYEQPQQPPYPSQQNQQQQYGGPPTGNPYDQQQRDGNNGAGYYGNNDGQPQYGQPGYAGPGAYAEGGPAPGEEGERGIGTTLAAGALGAYSSNKMGYGKLTGAAVGAAGAFAVSMMAKKNKKKKHGTRGIDDSDSE